jgi:excisionase family DNA binding protein
MATGHMTIEEAARHLGVTDRTVRGYISQGLLGTHKVKGSKRKWLAPDEVEELRLDRLEVGRLDGAVDDPKPWVPFLKLCLRMSQFLVEQPSYKTSVELQGLHREMNEGRRRLRISALCFMDLHSYDMDAAIRRAQLADSPRSVQDVLLSLAPKK